VVDNVQSELGDSDACISEATQIHILIFEFWELLVEAQNCSVILILGRIITDLGICSVRKACACRTLDVEDVSLLVPVVGVVPKVSCVASESKLTFRV
jgi:hypothetical protein